MCEEMEMPCPCQRCGEWFDLNDGIASDKWYPNTVICESCGRIEGDEIEIDNEIDDLKNAISDAEYTKSESEKRLLEIVRKEPWRNIDNGINFVESIINSPDAVSPYKPREKGGEDE